MGRIVDVETFLAQYNCKPEANNCTIAFHIADPFLEWNNRQITVTFHAGRCLLSNEKTNHHAHLSIGTLTTLLMGYKRASELTKLEKIQADEETIRLLDNNLIYEKPYISDYI